MRVLGVIPARLASTRLARKPLREVAGRPLLAWVVDAARACPGLDEIVVAADSDEVAELCHRIGVPVETTSPELPSGTDRMHAVAQLQAWNRFDIYINVQGDEPFLRPEHIAALLRPFAREHVDVTTLKVPCTAANLSNPNAVKVVTAADGRALYFSRSTIPYDRDAALGICDRDGSEFGEPVHWKHLGVYAYRRTALARFPLLPPSRLERIERLEQLRLVESGFPLYVEPVAFDTIGVDTEADLIEAERLLQHATPLNPSRSLSNPPQGT